MKQTDIVIVGAGISGLTAAIYLKRSNANFIVLEGNVPGGLLNFLKEVENYPGFVKSDGKTILNSLIEQVNSLNIDIEKGNVQSILKDPYGFKVVTDNQIILSKAVIVASGYKRNSEMIKGEKEYFGRGVSYCATCDGNFFKNQDVVVYGDGESSFEEALYLSNLVRTLYYVSTSKRTGFNKDNIKIISSNIVEIVGDDFGVKEIILSNNEKISCSGIFIYHGNKTAIEFLNGIKPSMNNNFIITDEDMKTDVEGLFAAGDVRNKSLRQLVTAASDGAIAAIEANKFIRILK